MNKSLSYSHLGRKPFQSILNKHIQNLASSGFTDVFPRGKYLKTVGETASFLWVRVLGSSVGFAVSTRHLVALLLLILGIDLLSVLHRL